MSATSPTSRATTRDRDTLRTVARLVAIVFLAVGVLGFVPGITTDYSSMGAAGTGSMAMLLGVFQVSVLHNIVHLLFGVVGLALSRTASGARNFLIGGGIVYAVLFLYGLFVPMGSQANFVPLNSADNWLHLLLAVGMVGLGVLIGRGARSTRA
jgi:hypothetical protein